MNPEAFWTLLTAHFGVGLAVSAGFLGLTATGLSLLSRDRKDSIALWLMRTKGSEETWARSFTAIFDSVFGARHLSLRCILSSVLASLVAVVALWLLFGLDDGLTIRLEAVPGIGTVLLIGLMVNATADYVSLLETRWLLGRMDRLRHWSLQALALLVDLVLTAAIIWAALWIFQRTGIYARLTGGDGEDLGEVLLIFSPFAVFFYSTFVTSLWAGLYILSTWVMRGLARLRLDRWFDVEGKPVKLLLAALGPALILAGFAGSVAISALTATDSTGVSVMDRAVCSLARDKACVTLAEMTGDEKQRLTMILTACEGGITGECLDRGGQIWERDGTLAARYWSASCGAGDPTSCTYLGYLHFNGIGMDKNPVEADRLYAKGCEGGDPDGCTSLGFLHQKGIGMDKNPVEADRLYAKGCEGGSALGCTNLGYLHDNGIGMDKNPVEAARLYAKGCEGGNALGCYNLGLMHEFNEFPEGDVAKAAGFFGIACDLGVDEGCDRAAALAAGNGSGKGQN